MARSARLAATTANHPSSATTPPTPRPLAAAPPAGANVAAAASAGPSGAAAASSSSASASNPSTPGASAGPSRPTRTSTRSRRSLGGAAAVPSPLSPADPNPPATPPASGAATPGGSSGPKAHVAPKVHGLRNAHTARERVACPFPAEYGGPQQCGVADEDAADDVLMAICGACATMGNVALSPDEIASIAFDHGWLRPPSVAVAPATMIQNAIRMHQSRCSKASPQRKPLITKYQLSGAMAESVLEPALHPGAFDAGTRPKGAVWYLSPDVGRAKWRNPFAGLVVPKAPARKPSSAKPRAIKPKKDDTKSRKKDSTTRESTPASTAAPSPAATDAGQPPRIKLRLSAASANTPGDESDVPECSRDSSRSQTVDSTPFPSTPSTPPPHQHAHSRRRRPRQSVFDSSDSETSSDDDDVPRRSAPRRIVLPPMVSGAGHRHVQPPPRAMLSPLGELFFSPLSTSQLPQPFQNQSPFPCHSLDNTIWGARRSVDDDRPGFDTSSSEDEEMRDPDWGTGSGVIVKAEDEQLPEAMKQDVQAKVDATTSAMSKLFPYEEPAGNSPGNASLGLDDCLTTAAPSESSSHADSASTVTAVFQGKLKSAACPNALPAWALSSPVSSPNMAGRALPSLVETSPTTFIRSAREWESRTMPIDMDVEMADSDEAWLDESGQLPVHAEDTFSDIEVGSTMGDLSTPERDRALHTAEWAQTTSALNIKQEPEDYYPSPAATSEPSSMLSAPSRESSVSTVSTASSPLSELPDLDDFEASALDFAQEVLIGPESVNLEELDDWLPGASKADRTPGRGRVRARPDRHDPQRGSWGGIGVNNPFIPCSNAAFKPIPPPLVRQRSSRSGARHARSTPRKAERVTPAPSPATEVVVIDVSPKVEVAENPQPPTSSPDDMELDDAIGTAELEKVAAEAAAREEQHHAQRRAAAKKQQQQWEECLRTFANACPTAPTTESGNSGSVSPVDTPSSAGPRASPWSELSPPWGSAESIPDLATPPMTLSPLALQMTPIVPPTDVSMLSMLNPGKMQSPPVLPDAMALDFSQEDIEAMAAQLPPSAPPPMPVPTPLPAPVASAPAPAPAAAPAPAPVHRSPPKKVLAPRPPHGPVPIAPAPPKHIKPKPPASDKGADKPAPPKPTKSASLPTPKVTPNAPTKAASVPAVPSLPAAPTAAKATKQAIAPAPPKPASAPAAPVPKPLTAAPAAAQPAAPKSAPAQSTPVQSAPVQPAPKPVAPAPVVAPTPTAAPAPTAPTPSAAPTASPSPAVSVAPTRTISPVARTTSSSPAASSASSSTVSTPSSATSSQGRPAGATTKRLLPGIDACVVDNLPCYSHIWDNPKGGRCTVLRRLDTDFVNGTALLTALGVPPARQPEHLNAPSPTLASHRTVPLISPQQIHHAPGVPGVWIPLVEARALAAKLGLQDATLLANILREDLFQLFKELAGISLRHTASTESFGMPFVTQPLNQRGKVPQRPQPNAAARPQQAAANGKPPLVRTSTQQPEGCPQPKRRRSTVAATGTTGPQAMQAAQRKPGPPQAGPPQARPQSVSPPAPTAPATVTNGAAPPAPHQQQAPAPRPQAPAPAKPSPPSSAPAPLRKVAPTPVKLAPAPAPPVTRAQQAKIAPAPPARRTRASLSGAK